MGRIPRAMETSTTACRLRVCIHDQPLSPWTQCVGNELDAALVVGDHGKTYTLDWFDWHCEWLRGVVVARE